MSDLHTGSVRVQVVDVSTLLLTIINADGDISLNLDSDGNGSCEATVAKNWDELY